MSRAYRNSSDVPLDAIIKRLHELSDAVVGGRKTQAQEFVMRVPAECDHDADLVLAEAAVRLDALRKYNAELQDENDNLRKANQDCVAWEKACKADLDRALARVCMQHDYLESLVSICTKQAKLLDSTADPLVDLTNRFLRRGDIDSGPGKAWLSRKQAEAVEAARDETCNGSPMTSWHWRVLTDYANHLRQQADQQENTHD